MFYIDVYHNIDVIMTTMASQITSLTVVYSTVYSDADQRNIKAPRHWPLCVEFTGTGEFPAQRASYAKKCFHLMTSSWFYEISGWRIYGWARSQPMREDVTNHPETLLETTNTTSLVVSRLRLILLEVYKSLHQLNAKCINGLFEVKSTRYYLRNRVKVLQPKKKGNDVWLKINLIHRWNDLIPI